MFELSDSYSFSENPLAHLVEAATGVAYSSDHHSYRKDEAFRTEDAWSALSYAQSHPEEHLRNLQTAAEKILHGNFPWQTDLAVYKNVVAYQENIENREILHGWAYLLGNRIKNEAAQIESQATKPKAIDYPYLRTVGNVVGGIASDLKKINDNYSGILSKDEIRSLAIFNREHYQFNLLEEELGMRLPYKATTAIVNKFPLTLLERDFSMTEEIEKRNEQQNQPPAQIGDPGPLPEDDMGYATASAPPVLDESYFYSLAEDANKEPINNHETFTSDSESPALDEQAKQAQKDREQALEQQGPDDQEPQSQQPEKDLSDQNEPAQETEKSADNEQEQKAEEGQEATQEEAAKVKTETKEQESPDAEVQQDKSPPQVEIPPEEGAPLKVNPNDPAAAALFAKAMQQQTAGAESLDFAFKKFAGLAREYPEIMESANNLHGLLKASIQGTTKSGATPEERKEMFRVNANAVMEESNELTNKIQKLPAEEQEKLMRGFGKYMGQVQDVVRVKQKTLDETINDSNRSAAERQRAQEDKERVNAIALVLEKIMEMILRIIEMIIAAIKGTVQAASNVIKKETQPGGRLDPEKISNTTKRIAPRFKFRRTGASTQAPQNTVGSSGAGIPQQTITPPNKPLFSSSPYAASTMKTEFRTPTFFSPNEESKAEIPVAPKAETAKAIDPLDVRDPRDTVPGIPAQKTDDPKKLDATGADLTKDFPTTPPEPQNTRKYRPG